MITHFDSIREYYSFVTAREFWDRQNNQIFNATPSRVEKIGGWIASPIMRSADWAFRNIKSPLFITSMVIVGIAAATILFYPAHFIALVGFILPSITPGMAKLGLYLLTQSTILGLFLRTWGRLNPSGELMQAWETRNDHGERRLIPMTLGMIQQKP